VLTVANFNLHAGVDGWGRPFDTIAVCRELGTDVMALEESWTSAEAGAPDEIGQAEQIAAALGYEAFTCALAEGRRSRPDPAATDKWMSPQGLRAGRNALFFDSERPYSAHVSDSPRFTEAERGTWGIAVLVRRGMTVDDSRILHLPQLGRDRVRRAAMVVDLTVDHHQISVIGTHMSHLQFGSHRHYASLKKRLRTGEARPDAVLLGDMNLWGPPVRIFLPQWHRAVKGPTWPAGQPHSQIDHILVRGAIEIVRGEVRPNSGSDHRPVVAELALR
jgi:endonuclease/exonuclease/phosphatase family metal-dependent hydrolase